MALAFVPGSWWGLFQFTRSQKDVISRWTTCRSFCQPFFCTQPINGALQSRELEQQQRLQSYLRSSEDGRIPSFQGSLGTKRITSEKAKATADVRLHHCLYFDICSHRYYWQKLKPRHKCSFLCGWIWWSRISGKKGIIDNSIKKRFSAQIFTPAFKTVVLSNVSSAVSPCTLGCWPGSLCTGRNAHSCLGCTAIIVVFYTLRVWGDCLLTPHCSTRW